MRTFTADEKSAVTELMQFITDYWYEVDINGARQLTEFYTPDCTYFGGMDITYKGHEGIEKFYANSRAVKEADRISRHMVSNVRVVPHGKDGATVHYNLTTYGASGKPPIEVDFSPMQITDIRNECVRDAGGRWRIAEFHGQPMFYSPHHVSKRLAGWPKK
jgi:ketosteroid isomerase-like protein